MLILTRKIGEIIRIGDDVTVRVLGLRGGQVSLGFTAPNEVRIFREEVLLADQAALESAAAAGRKRPVERSTDGAAARGASADTTRTAQTTGQSGRPRSSATRTV